MTLPLMPDVDIRRFWSKVSLPDSGGCMLWRGALDHYGYGVFAFKGRPMKAHRTSLGLADGPPPFQKAEGAHSCRNRHCVAPAHLRWATPAENERDKVRDGTHNRGEQQGAAKLTRAQVAEIRHAYAAGGISQRELGLQYGVTQSNVSAIMLNRSWTHLNERA